MKKGKIMKLLERFENYSNKRNDVEFWYARDLQLLFGYNKWDNFLKVL